MAAFSACLKMLTLAAETPCWSFRKLRSIAITLYHVTAGSPITSYMANENHHGCYFSQVENAHLFPLKPLVVIYETKIHHNYLISRHSGESDH